MFFFFCTIGQGTSKGFSRKERMGDLFSSLQSGPQEACLASQPSPPNQHVDIIACASRACLEIVMILGGGAIS